MLYLKIKIIKELKTHAQGINFCELMFHKYVCMYINHTFINISKKINTFAILYEVKNKEN